MWSNNSTAWSNVWTMWSNACGPALAPGFAPLHAAAAAAGGCGVKSSVVAEQSNRRLSPSSQIVGSREVSLPMLTKAWTLLSSGKSCGQTAVKLRPNSGQTAVKVRSNCDQTVVKNCGQTAVKLGQIAIKLRSKTAVKLGSNCGQTAFKVQSNRGQTAVKLRSNCGQTAVKLRSKPGRGQVHAAPGGRRHGHRLLRLPARHAQGACDLYNLYNQDLYNLYNLL